MLGGIQGRCYELLKIWSKSYLCGLVRRGSASVLILFLMFPKLVVEKGERNINMESNPSTSQLIIDLSVATKKKGSISTCIFIVHFFVCTLVLPCVFQRYSMFCIFLSHRKYFEQQTVAQTFCLLYLCQSWNFFDGFCLAFMIAISSTSVLAFSILDIPIAV